MKRLSLAAIFLLMVFLGFAAPAISASQTSKSLTFQWEQPVDLGYISGWSLYWSATAGSGYEKVVVIPYTMGDPSTAFITTTVLNVTGTPGETVNKFFVLTANGKNGIESSYSNEVSDGFVFSYPTPAAPFILIIKVIVGGN